MFQDYCASHGKPTPANSLYCSEECRDLDLDSTADFGTADYGFKFDFDDIDNAADHYVDSPTMEPMIDDLESSLSPLQSRSSSISSASASYSETPLLYECCFCNASHSPHVSCNEALGDNNYTYNPQLGPVTISKDHATPISLPLDHDYQNSLKNNHDLILSNYRKWLGNISPTAV